MMNWSEGTKVFYGSHYAALLKDAVRFTDLESVEKYKLSLAFNVESTETLVGKVWIETKELVQLSWVFVKDSVSYVWAIMRDGSKYLWGKLCDLFAWLVSLFKKKEATPASTPVAAPVAPTAGGTVDPTADTTATANTTAPVAATAGGTVDPTAAVIEGTVV
jgi:hypothetical protein